MSRARTNKENRPKRPSTLGLLLGGTGGRKDASKGAEAERQRRRRERDRSSEMAAYVGYDAMYRDGIAQVMPGMFSQTVEFSDISYQSARKEARETAFTVMSSLFNYFPADSHVQLLVERREQAQLAEAVGLTEGAVRHYESGIRAVKPELLESISAALGVSVNALKDYGVETAGDLMSLLVRLEDSFGIVPAADGTGLSLNPKAPHAPKAAMAIELWAEKRAQLENGKIDADEYEDWKASL